MKKKVFLGGTCADTNWREQLIPHLKIDYFNPVVEDWTEECIAEEERQKKICNIHLYLITSEMKGVYSIAEVVQSSHDKNVETFFCVIPDGFTEGELKSLRAVYVLVESNGAIGYIGNNMAGIGRVINRL